MSADLELDDSQPTSRLVTSPDEAIGGDQPADMSAPNSMDASVWDTKRPLALCRQTYTQDQLDKSYRRNVQTRTSRQRVDEFRASCGKRTYRTLLGYFPIISTLRNYKWKEDIVSDLAAGISVSFLQMPMGVALGLLASLPAIYGLYTTFFSVTLYIIFGKCPHSSMGTNALLSLITANVVETELAKHMSSVSTIVASTTASTTSLPGAVTEPSSLVTPPVLSLEEQDMYKVGVATSLAFFSGALLLGMGLLRFGFVGKFMSASFLGGFTTAAAVHISVSQLPKILAIKIPGHTGAGKLVKTMIDIFKNIEDTNPADLIISIISITILLLVGIFINERYQSKLKVPVPIHLLLVVVATLISHFTQLKERFGIAVVGKLSTGFESPTIPNLDVVGSIMADAFVLAILTYAMSISMAKITAKVHTYDVDDNQEFVAYGMCNFVGSFFGCFPTCVAPPRNMLLSNTGAKTTLNGVFTAALILLVLMTAGQLLYSLPVAVLAAMICVAVRGLLLQVTHIPRLWRVSKPDCLVWVFTCLVGVLVDLDIGIIAGVGLSILSIVVFSQVLSSSVGGISKTEDLVLLDSNRLGVSDIRGVRIFYFPSQLYFVNVEKFKKELFDKVLNPGSVKETVVVQSNGDTGKYDVTKVNICEGLDKDSCQDVKFIILDCSAMTYIDIAGVDMMKTVAVRYQKAGVKMYLARVPTYTLQVLKEADFFKTVPADCIVHDVYDALAMSDIAALGHGRYEDQSQIHTDLQDAKRSSVSN